MENKYVYWFGAVAIVVVTYFVARRILEKLFFESFDTGVAPGMTREDYDKEYARDISYGSAPQPEPKPAASASSPASSASAVESDMKKEEQELMDKAKELTNEDLLPKESDDFSLLGKNFLAANFQPGIDTRGPSMKNANLQLRSDPVVPKADNLTPFNNSTYEQDMMRKKFEIGE